MQMLCELKRWRFYNIITHGVLEKKWHINSLVQLIGKELTRDLIRGVDDIRTRLGVLKLEDYWVDVVLNSYIKDLIL